MSNKRSHRIKKIILGQSLISLLILFVAGILIFYSQGFRINPKNFKVYKTSVLVLVANPKADKVDINGKEYPIKSSFAMNIIPGDYNISVSKAGYQNWTMFLHADSEKLYDFKDIDLFLASPEISELTEQSKIDYLNSPDSVLVENAPEDLNFNQYEIWIGDDLVTRFSETISEVKWFPDMKHVLFCKSNAVWSVEENGSNITKLFDYDAGASIKFAVGGQGKEIYYYNGDKYYRVKIK